ncbi:TlpA disulfide reductase family protein [Amycolatopsis sp. GM8]|uniref:TlpA family protein disulfide reductase n=1 Tax=Amycolatopsis sp. GM8 TaxID=2896530 RepID=UPI001F40721D|nr:TlpA disulfide reductase family protein [Amycolatopsis sp. GM8]
MGMAAGCATGNNAPVQDGNGPKFYDPALRVEIEDVSGSEVINEDKTISVAEFRGKVVVLNMWGSWCPPCRVETYELNKLADDTKSELVQVVGIDVRDDRARAADFIYNFQLNYPSIFDPAGRVGLSLPGIPLIAPPTTVVIDKEQRVAAVFLGQILASDVMPAVQRVLAEL